MIIYTASVNNEIVYVGQTVQNFANRIGSHRSNARKGIKLPIYSAIRKYGENEVKFQTIEDNISSQEELDFLEIYYIKHFTPRYNIQRGGKNGFIPWNKGRKETRKSVRNNISKSAKTRTKSKRGHYTEKHKDKISYTSLARMERPFICLNTGVIYLNKISCAVDLGIPAVGISLVLMPTTRNKSYYGYKFQYL